MALYLGSSCVGLSSKNDIDQLEVYSTDMQYDAGVATVLLPSAYNTLETLASSFVCGTVLLTTDDGVQIEIAFNPRRRPQTTSTTFYTWSFGSSNTLEEFARGSVTNGSLVLSIDPYTIAEYTMAHLTLVMEVMQ